MLIRQTEIGPAASGVLVKCNEFCSDEYSIYRYEYILLVRTRQFPEISFCILDENQTFAHCTSWRIRLGSSNYSTISRSPQPVCRTKRRKQTSIAMLLEAYII